jgi:hypothetical protein
LRRLGYEHSRRKDEHKDQLGRGRARKPLVGLSLRAPLASGLPKWLWKKKKKKSSVSGEPSDYMIQRPTNLWSQRLSVMLRAQTESIDLDTGNHIRRPTRRKRILSNRAGSNPKQGPPKAPRIIFIIAKIKKNKVIKNKKMPIRGRGKGEGGQTILSKKKKKCFLAKEIEVLIKHSEFVLIKKRIKYLISCKHLLSPKKRKTYTQFCLTQNSDTKLQTK